MRQAEALLAEIRGMLAPPRGKAQKQRWRELVDGKLAELGRHVADPPEGW